MASLQIIKNLLAGFLLVCFAACSPYPSGQKNSTDAINTSSDSSKLDTTEFNQSDTLNDRTDTTNQHGSINPDREQKNKRYGILGYSYFKNMRQNETRNINAYVSIINSTNQIIDTLKEINNEIQPERANDTASIYTKNIILYKYLKIRLIDPDSDFTIKPIHENDRQEIDSLAGNSWVWAITPRTDKERSRLLLKVIAEKPNGSKEAFEVRNIPIIVNVDKGIFRVIYLWLYHNPEKAIVVVLIPLVGFFWKQIVSIFQNKKSS